MFGLFLLSVPGPVANLVVVESKETSNLVVSWDPPANEACVEEYLVKFEYLSACNETSEPQMIEIQSTDNPVNVTGVPPGASYTVFVLVRNYLGEGTSVQNGGTTALQGIYQLIYTLIFANDVKVIDFCNRQGKPNIILTR